MVRIGADKDQQVRLFSFNKGTVEGLDGIVRSTRWQVTLDRNPTSYFHLYLYIGQEMTSSTDGSWRNGYGYYAFGLTTGEYMKSERMIQWGRQHDYNME